MQVAVIGGSGFVGEYLVRALLNNGHYPSLLVRSGSGPKVPQAERCRIINGDLSSREAIEATVGDCDAAIYNVGILREFPHRGITYEQTQFEGVQALLAAAKSTGTRRLLLMSANGVEKQGTPYQATKYRAERLAHDSGLDVTTFRPSVIFGDPRGKLEIATQLYRDMVDTPLPAVGFFGGWLPRAGVVEMSPVHVEDVADAFMRALDDPRTIGGTFVLGGPERLTWNEMIRRVAAAAGRRKWIVPMPIALMRLPALLFDRLPFFPVTRDQLTMLAEGNVAEPVQLQELIGREPRAFSAMNLTYLCN